MQVFGYSGSEVCDSRIRLKTKKCTPSWVKCEGFAQFFLYYNDMVQKVDKIVSKVI